MRGRGQPRIGRVVAVTLPDEVIAWLDSRAEPRGRAKAIREILQTAIAAERE